MGCELPALYGTETFRAHNFAIAFQAIRPYRTARGGQSTVAYRERAWRSLTLVAFADNSRGALCFFTLFAGGIATFSGIRRCSGAARNFRLRRFCLRIGTSIIVHEHGLPT
jgi:hypothetical protein